VREQWRLDGNLIGQQRKDSLNNQFSQKEDGKKVLDILPIVSPQTFLPSNSYILFFESFCRNDKKRTFGVKKEKN